MIIKRFITFVIALSLAFSVSTAMAGKSDKSDKSGKSWNQSEKSDKSDKSRKGKKGKKSKKSNKSDKSAKSDKSGKSDKSEKSGKSDKGPPTSCFSDWDFSADPADLDSGLVDSGVITGTACTADEVNDILETAFSPVGAPDTTCFVDEEISEFPDLEIPGPYELNLSLTCSTDSSPPPPPPD